MAEHERMHGMRKFGGIRGSGDSGLASERSSESLAGSSRSSSVHSDSHDEDEEHLADEKSSFLQDSSVDRVLSSKFPGVLASKIVTGFDIVYVLLERFMIILGYAAVIFGIADCGGIGGGDHIYNIAAHLVKGSIFFLYGIITFGRYMGSFADQGWAWNAKPSEEIVGWRSKVPSAEFVESAVIACYGYSNMWMEHMAASDGPWTAMVS